MRASHEEQSEQIPNEAIVWVRRARDRYDKP